MAKLPLDVPLMLHRISDAVEPYPKAALFELADEGFRSPFEQLVACILSIRTRDETTLPASRALFERARTPAELLAAGEAEIDRIIRPVTFHERKAGQIAAMARSVVEEHRGELPCDPEVMLAFPGVGPKCAHLALGIACGEPYIGVDVHVHRITNRWGYVHTRSPEQTMHALREKLPRELWVEINRLLVPFGKHVCTGRLPKCSTCPVLDRCRQVGVEEHR